MIGILVKNGNAVIEKQVFSGNVSVVPTFIENYQIKHPSLTVEIHQDTDPDWITAFDQIMITPSLTPEQTGWQTAKSGGAQQALLYIAKYLGLE